MAAYAARRMPSAAPIDSLLPLRQLTVGMICATSIASLYWMAMFMMRVEQRFGQVVRLQAEVEQLGVLGVEVVLLRPRRAGSACARCGLEPELVGSLRHHVGELVDAELLRELVVDAHLAAVGRVEECQLDAAHGVADVEEAAGLAALAVDGHRVTDGRLDAEAVERRAEDVVVVEAVEQPGCIWVCGVTVP